MESRSIYSDIYSDFKLDENKLRVLVVRTIEDLEYYTTTDELIEIMGIYKVYRRLSSKTNEDVYFIIGKDLGICHYEISPEDIKNYGEPIDYEVLIQSNKYNL
jgi:hypothetical protein